jgi:predicted nucleic acid-binding protein
MIVVDTNVIGYLFLTSDQSESAERALRRDAGWAAPLLWRSELRNVLAFYLRQDQLRLDDARQIMAATEELMRGREFAVASAQVLALAAESGRSAYDCEFVALARELNVPLVTADPPLLRAFPDTAVSLADFAAG